MSLLPARALTKARSEPHTLQTHFPFLVDAVASPIRGGRRAAEAALAAIDPSTYTRSRNFLNGAVTRLSPYLRHGVLTLAEVRDAALARVSRPEDAEKFINELGWRDYWQRLYVLVGEEVWKDREAYKTGYSAGSYADTLPAALSEGTTGLRCMDSFSNELRATGYLHNHARMWMAAYTVHWLRVRWQAGARWFLEHLLDGDPASNNLSWQWVASTFSSKPYYFNRENLERYTHGSLCRDCSLREQGCPFEGEYEALEQKLFPRNGQSQDSSPAAAALHEDRKPTAQHGDWQQPLVWIHTDGLNPKSSLFANPAPTRAVFVWDEDWMRQAKISSKRVLFLAECLEEFPEQLEQRAGDPAAEVAEAARAAGADHVLAQRTADPRLLAAAAQLERALPVVWVDPPRFVDDSRSYELKRFSRYWQKAQHSALQPTRS